jgi:acyl carrier protein
MSDVVPQIKQVLSGLFNVSVDTLSIESSTDNVAGWNSLGHLMVVIELEQEFGIQISPERGEQLTSVARIAEFLKDHQLSADTSTP